MFYRKISNQINLYFNRVNNPILLIDGARQIGKTFIISNLGKEKFENYVEINLANDFIDKKYFASIGTVDDFYNQLTALYGNKLGNAENTLIFLDEIQVYPNLLTLLKPLRADNRYRYICSGSQLGIALKKSTLIPIGSIETLRMYPMDFEEFMLANDVSEAAIKNLRQAYLNSEPLNDGLHNFFLDLFKKYLIVGGLPMAVKRFVEDKNIALVRREQTNIHKFYGSDAAQYDVSKSLKIQTIYNLMLSNHENKVKRFQISNINQERYSKFSQFNYEFEYLISSGIALECRAISEPKFPLVQSEQKNLLKLYYNDVGVLTNLLYKNNINAVLNTESGVNLGSVYETVVAQELKAHGHNLFYFDKRKLGEVDFLVDDYDNLCPLPIEVKSGKDFMKYQAMPKMLDVESYRIKKGIVFSNERQVFSKDNIIHYPIYYVMFI